MSQGKTLDFYITVLAKEFENLLCLDRARFGFRFGFGFTLTNILTSFRTRFHVLGLYSFIVMLQCLFVCFRSLNL